MPSEITHHASSFRDPSGFIFEKDGVIYRQVNKNFSETFDFFIAGGCYDAMVSKGLLIPHETIHENLTGEEQWYITLKPEQLLYTSYPWEWSFSMLQDAALLTLAVLKEGLEWGMILKDATPYNIQWHKGKLVFIDSLSFEKYDELAPWIAYRQFCEQFLSPLLLSHYAGQPLNSLLLAYPDGIPVAVTSSMLPGKSRFNMHTYLHIHMQAKYSAKPPGASHKKINFSKKKLLDLVNSLEILVKKLKLPLQQTNWSEYYDEAGQRNGYLEEKKHLVSKCLEQLKPATMADFGANTGTFSKLARKETFVISNDLDPFCIDRLYRELKGTDVNILPLVIDLSIPSPAIGVNNNERPSFIQRTRVDLGLALALVHHLAIGKNIPFNMIAAFFNKTCRNLVIEFIPKSDEKIRFMLQNKKDIYTDYNEENFCKAFEQYFIIEEKKEIGGSGRTLYRMKRHER